MQHWLVWQPHLQSALTGWWPSPYFAGERTPLLDPDAKGAIFGLGLTHTRADVYRAFLESVGYGIRHNIDRMREEGADPPAHPGRWRWHA